MAFYSCERSSWGVVIIWKEEKFQCMDMVRDETSLSLLFKNNWGGEE